MRGILRSILIAGLIAGSVFPSLAAPRRDSVADRRPVFAHVRNDDAGVAESNPSRNDVIARGAYPLNAIIENIRRSYPGRSLETEGPYEQGGRMVYRIKWWTNGRVIVFFADAETGQIIAQRGG
jgi:uncharacterized membrane protein YkoI